MYMRGADSDKKYYDTSEERTAEKVQKNIDSHLRSPELGGM